MTPVGPADAPGLSRNRRLLVLGICSMSLLLVSLDVTIVNVALPSIHRSFHASLQGLQWTLDAYTLVLASLLMLSGATADRIGRKRVFTIGLVIFTGGSALCAAAQSLDMLVAARVLQAIGGSMLNPVAMSIIRNTFEDPKERAQAIGVWGAVVGISTALGPVVGGALVDGAGWRFVFLVNVPIGIAALMLTRLFVPESQAPRARRIDPLGQLLVIVLLASLVYAIIEGQHDGWGSATIVGLFIVAALSLGTLIAYEQRRREPLIELRFFRSAPFSGASLTAICAFAAFGGFLFLNTVYLQDVRGFSALHAGLYSLPLAVMMLILAPISGRIVGQRGARIPLLLAGVLLTAGPLLLIGLTPHTSVGLLIGAYFVLGAGIGLINAPITVAAVSGMPPAQAGVASAIASTSRQIGFALGVAIVGAVTGAGDAHGFGPGFASATHPGWFVISGLGALVLILAVLSTNAWALGTAKRTAELFA